MKNITAKILLIDDKVENLFSLEAMLSFDDLEIFKANSGEEALKLLLKHTFALIISDISMPEMDGFEVLKFIRMDSNNSKTPVILATAYNKEDKFIYKGYDEGAVDYLIKPLDNDVTRSKVRVFVELYKHRLKLEQQKQQLQIVKRAINTILIAEDEPLSLKILQNLLSEENYQVITSINGSDCLEKYVTHKPDVIITDINMDVKTGKDLTKEIRQNDSNTLIFGLTADTRVSEKEECLNMGINAIVFKPVNKNELQNLLQDYSI